MWKSCVCIHRHPCVIQICCFVCDYVLWHPYVILSLGPRMCMCRKFLHRYTYPHVMNYIYIYIKAYASAASPWVSGRRQVASGRGQGAGCCRWLQVAGCRPQASGRWQVAGHPPSNSKKNFLVRASQPQIFVCFGILGSPFWKSGG